MHKFLKIPYTLEGFEPGVFCSVDGRYDPYPMPPGFKINYYFGFEENGLSKNYKK
jgi:hypothetical protein